MGVGECVSVGESVVCGNCIQKPLNMKRVGGRIETSRLQVMLSVRVYLHVCVTDMGMDMHACIVSAHTFDFKREEKKKQREITILI